MPPGSLRFARRRVRAAVLRGRYEYPLGVADRCQFASRLTYWNYAALLRTDWEEDLGLQALAEFSKTNQCVGRVVSIGSGQKWEIRELEKLFGSVDGPPGGVTHIALSPFLVWTSAVHHNQWANTLYIPGAMADRFLMPGHNWVFLKTLEMVENPQAWVSTAVEQAEEWVYFLVDQALPRRLQDVDRSWLQGQFPVGEWEMYVHHPSQKPAQKEVKDPEQELLECPEKLLTAAPIPSWSPRSALPSDVFLGARKLGLLFLRKKTHVPSEPPATSESSENAS